MIDGYKIVAKMIKRGTKLLLF